MKAICTLVAALALGACASFDNDTWPHSIERGAQSASSAEPCWTRTYHPTPDEKTTYDAVIPPTYDAPSQVPSYCRKLRK